VTAVQMHANAAIDDTLSGTTAISIIFFGDTLYICNVSPSRQTPRQDKRRSRSRLPFPSCAGPAGGRLPGHPGGAERFGGRGPSSRAALRRPDTLPQGQHVAPPPVGPYDGRRTSLG
jgi:hypothetical protein